MRSQPLTSRALRLAVLGVGVLVVATIVGEHERDGGTTLLLLDIVAGAIGLGLLTLLPRWPVWTTLALAVLSLASPALVPTSTVAILFVARTRPLRTAASVAVPGVLGHVLRHGWRPLPGLDLGWYALIACAVYAALLAWGARGRVQDQLVASLRERARAAEAEQSRLVAEARRAERTRVAREMHDGLAHRLAMVATHAGALEFRPDAAPEQIAAAAAVVRSGIHDAMDELRDVILLLRDDPSTDGSTDRSTDRSSDDPSDAGTESDRHPVPTLADLPALVHEVEQVGATIRLSLDPATTHGLPAGAGRAAYRVVQEALTNARRHAPGAPITVTVGGQPGGRLTVEVTNPLAATTPAPSQSPVRAPGLGVGVGLLGLHERVQLAGGALDAGPEGSRFRVHAWLPWPDEATGAGAARRR